MIPRQRVAVFASVTLWGCVAPVPATQSLGGAPYVVPNTETHRLVSAFVGDSFQVVVSLPRSYDEGVDSFPIVVALDADLAFAATAQIVRLMQFRGEIPEALVVGVGYGDFQTALGKRRRDLTPTSPAHYADCEAPGSCGGAEPFLRFLREEMLPFVAERYRIRTKGATLVGASLGGLFGGFVLARHPEAFAAYVLGSPTVAWDDHWLLDQLADAPAAAGRVFIGVGGGEGPGVDDASRFAEGLRGSGAGPRSVRLHVFEGEKHMSVQPMVLSRGLRVLVEDSGTPH